MLNLVYTYTPINTDWYVVYVPYYLEFVYMCHAFRKLAKRNVAKPGAFITCWSNYFDVKLLRILIFSKRCLFLVF
jgi:hypothetical protein